MICFGLNSIPVGVLAVLLEQGPDVVVVRLLLEAQLVDVVHQVEEELRGAPLPPVGEGRGHESTRVVEGLDLGLVDNGGLGHGGKVPGQLPAQPVDDAVEQNLEVTPP